MTVSQKLFLGISSIMAVVILNTIVNNVNLNTIDTLSVQSANESLPFAILAADTKFQTCQIQQFVTDSSLTQDEEVLKEAEEAYAKLISNIEKFEVMFKNENDTQSLKEVYQIKERAIELLDTGKRMKTAYARSFDSGNIVMEELDKDAEELATLVDNLKNIQIKEAANNANLITEKASLSFQVGLLLGILTLLIGVFVGFILSKNINNGLSSFQKGLFSFFAYLNRESSKADLIEINSKDEFGQMAIVVNENIIKTQKGIEEDRKLIDETIVVLSEFEQGDLCQRLNISVNNPALMQLKTVLNQMASNLENNIDNVLNVLEQYSNYNYLKKVDQKGLKEHLLKLANGVNTLGDAITGMLVENKSNGLTLDESSNILLANVDKLNQSSNEAAASLEETAAALEEMTSNIRNNTENIAKMASLSSSVTSSANKGEKLANQTTVAMEEINAQVTAINEAISVIDQIAFQTNILSLNAAVEAATAGEAGKGFAVVAQEVRNLAARSAEAAKEIKDIVERATSKANEGKAIANDMIQGYSELNKNISHTINLISDIEHASKEQLLGIEQINDAVTQLDQQTQQNAMVASQTHDVAVLTDEIAKLVVSNADAKQFVGKDSVRAKEFKKPDHHMKVPARTEKVQAKPISKKVTQVSKQTIQPVTPSAKSGDSEWEAF